MNKHSIALFLLPALALAISAGIWVSQQRPTDEIRLLPEAENCQLHQSACRIDDDELHIELNITPKPVPIAKALDVSAQITGITPARVQLDINGSNMYMGYNRIDLTPQANNLWIGKTLLAFCTIDQMSWQVTLMIETDTGEQIQVPFPLVTPYQP
jgi:hypothetical protein